MTEYTSNVISFISNSVGTFNYSVVANDITGASSTSCNISVLVNPPLSKATMVFPVSTNTLVEGQPIQLVANVLGGTQPYTYNFLISQQGNPSNVIAEFSEANTYNTIGSTVWFSNTIGTFVANVMVTDAVGESANSVYSANIDVLSGNFVAPPPNVMLFPFATGIDVNENDSYFAVISEAPPPVTANLIYVSASGTSNAVLNGVLPGNVIQTVTIESEPNVTFGLPFNAIIFPYNGIYTFNVVATDSAVDSISNSVTFNSVVNSIEVNPPPSISSFSPLNKFIDLGQNVTYTAVISGGTLPITAYLNIYYYTSSGEKTFTQNVIIYSEPGGSNTITFAP
ncbi:MAG: hypothetical protein RAK22_03000, partial [Nanoarchaeota archaeon]|nr:hypothetical protein [Nanoarchaeota archaeon]